MDNEEVPMAAVFEAMALSLLSLAMDDPGEKDFTGRADGDLLTLQVGDPSGEACLLVVGMGSAELAEELVLACLHNISVERLGALQLRELNRGVLARR